MANTGILIFAHNCNSSKRDYLYSASICAKTIKQQNPDIPISLLTRNKLFVSPGQTELYDNVIEFPFDDAGHLDDNTLKNFYQLYYATPYENTLVLDADTLVLGKLDGLFAAARRHDMLFPHSIKDFRNVCHSVQQKIQEKNSLPQFETSIWYFNKDFDKKKEYRYEGRERIELDSSEEDTEPFFNLLEVYLRSHEDAYNQFEHERPAEFDKDFLFSLTIDNLDLANDIVDTNILTYTDLSLTNGELWHEDLNYWIKEGNLKIENYNVTGIIHYGNKAFEYDELDRFTRSS